MILSAVREHTAFLITAAGNSSRFSSYAPASSPVKKEYLLLDGVPLLSRTASACLESLTASIFVLIHTPGQLKETREALAGIDAPLRYVPGGSTRQESVRLGLEYLGQLTKLPRYVLIHDGARPWVSAEIISRVLETTVSKGAAAPVVPLSDAVKQVSSDSRITAHLERSSAVGIQTPQGFRFPEILEAHRKAAHNGKRYVDDTEIYADYIGEVYTVEGDIANRKVTYPGDLGLHKGVMQ